MPYDDNLVELRAAEFSAPGQTSYINASPITFGTASQVLDKDLKDRFLQKSLSAEFHRMPGAQEKWFQPLLASHCAGRGDKI